MMTGCCFEQILLEETLHVIGSTTPLKTIVPHTTLLALPQDVVAPERHRISYTHNQVLPGQEIHF
jgi:hypothetical protein